MQAALSNFIELKETHKCLILGDMLELGETSAEEHQKIVDDIERYDFDEIFLVGPRFGKTICRKKEKKFENIELLSNYLKTQPIENKLVLIKGSRGIHLENILEQLTA
jgi:UDP-N-acetylmuramoyl-tripeptide--D-alanyl-D-alanine ligase